MLRWIILAVAVVFLTAAATLLVQFLPDSAAGPMVPVARTVPTGPQPKLEIAQDLVYEFGKMSQHSQDKHSWEIRNAGEGTLELWMEGTPTCSCTIANLQDGKKAVVQPGESTAIELQWDTKAFQDTYSQGATFGTNDPSRPTFKLAVHGKVYPPVVVYPQSMMTFPSISNEESHHSLIAVFSPDRPKLKLTKLTTSKPGLIVAKSMPMEAKEAQSLKAEAGYRVTVEIKPGMPLGRFQEELVIQTDHPNQSEVKVVVLGNVTGPISVIPEGLRWPDVSGRQGATRDLTMLVRGGRQTRFDVAHKPEKVEVAIIPDDKPTLKGRYRMTVTVPAGTTPGPVHDQIILKTDHPKVSELKIPVNIFVSR
jgi:hypothetical protein